MSFYFQNKLRRRSQRLLQMDQDPQHVDGLLRCGVYGVDDALLLAGVAASAAGTGMSVAANSQAQSAMQKVRNVEAKRQADLQTRANQVFQKSLSTSGADTAKNKIDTGTAQRQSIYDALKQVAQPTAGAPLPNDDSPETVVGSDGATRTANSIAQSRGNAWSTLTSNAAAREGGYEDYQASDALKNAEANRNLGVINNRARGWANLMPLELNVASHKGDALSGWGQLVSALGSVAGVVGAIGPATAGISSADLANAAGPVVDGVGAVEDPGAWSLIGQSFV